MDPFAVSHFSDNALLHDLKALVAQDRKTTAVLLTRLAEVDERKLYLREGYASMYDYCLRALHLSEGAAYKRLNAARAARQFPVLLVAVAEGRLHLSAVVTLAAHLTAGNADELVAAATHKTRAEIELSLAQRFPRPDLTQRLRAIPQPPLPIPPPTPPQADQLSPGKVDVLTFSPLQPAMGPVRQLSPGTGEAPAPRARMTPLSPERFGLQLTIDKETHDLLQRAQALMSHQVPTGEIAPVLKSALKLLVAQLEKHKYAATDRPGRSRRGSSARHVPAAVKRAVRERDGGRCAFVSDSGQRCGARTMLEFDHVDPVARGGDATAENVRLVCRAHNQYTAERTFGADFMERKRAEARRAGHRGKCAGVLGFRLSCPPS